MLNAIHLKNKIMDFQYKIEEYKGLIIVELSGNLLAIETSKKLIDELTEHIKNEKANIILDLGKMNNLNSSGLNVFIQLLTKARNAGGDVIVTNISQKINKLLIIIKLNTVFSVAESKEIAMNELVNLI